MSIRVALAAMLLVALCAAVAGAKEAPPEPDFDRVDHGKPKAALALCKAFGSEKELRKIAKGLKAETPLDTIAAVDSWVRANFAYDADAAYAWRDFATMRKDGTYGGCADHAILFGSLLRAAGIPTVFVKTMDCDWIRAFATGHQPSSWSGHCFLEVFLDGTWALLDASAMRLTRLYDPSQRILPGPRYAYDKGLDPYELVKSVRWELWKEQTRAYFTGFDLGKLPAPRGARLGAVPPVVYAAANGPYWKWLHERCQALGLPENRYASFNTAFDEKLRKARGEYLILTSVGGTPVLPRKWHAELLPLDVEAIAKAERKKPFGIVRDTLPDGTRVALIHARDEAAMKQAVAAFTFREP